MNPFARPYACPRCRDTRTLTRTSRASKDDVMVCDKCGSLSKDEYDRFRRDAWGRDHNAPEICELDLNDGEFKVYQKMRDLYPNVSKLTTLAWMEGQRYDPAKDPAFMEQVETELEKWRARP